MAGQSRLRRKGDVTGAYVHALRQRNSMYVQTVRRSIDDIRRPEHPKAPIRRYKRHPQGPPSRPRSKCVVCTHAILMVLQIIFPSARLICHLVRMSSLGVYSWFPLGSLDLYLVICCWFCWCYYCRPLGWHALGASLRLGLRAILFHNTMRSTSFS